MPDAVESVLRLVAEGRLTPAEAEPILAALDATIGPGAEADDARRSSSTPRTRSLRVEITDAGRPVVNLRFPASLGEVALAGIPGLSGPNLDRIRAAIRSGASGSLLEVGDPGDRVRILIE